MITVFSGLLQIGMAAYWANRGVRALVVNRRGPAFLKHRDRARQWLTLAALNLIFGVLFITDPHAEQRAAWWLAAGFGALLAWVLIDDLGSWRRRSRARGCSGHQPL